MEGVRKRKRELSLLATTGERLRYISRVSSGGLATIDEYHLGVDLRDLVVGNETEKISNKKRIEMNQHKKQHESKRKYFKLLETIQQQPNNKLTTKEMRCLLTNNRLHGDSPLKVKVADLRTQWGKRKYRIDLFSSCTSNENNESNENQKADENFALHDDIDTVALNTEFGVGLIPNLGEEVEKDSLNESEGIDSIGRFMATIDEEQADEFHQL